MYARVGFWVVRRTLFGSFSRARVCYSFSSLICASPAGNRIRAAIPGRRHSVSSHTHSIVIWFKNNYLCVFSRVRPRLVKCVIVVVVVVVEVRIYKRNALISCVCVTHPVCTRIPALYCIPNLISVSNLWCGPSRITTNGLFIFMRAPLRCAQGTARARIVHICLCCLS